MFVHLPSFNNITTEVGAVDGPMFARCIVFFFVLPIHNIVAVVANEHPILACVVQMVHKRLFCDHLLTAIVGAGNSGVWAVSLPIVRCEKTLLATPSSEFGHITLDNKKGFLVVDYFVGKQFGVRLFLHGFVCLLVVPKAEIESYPTGLEMGIFQ